ncbi:MAG: hypothetical protein LBF27_32575 [Sphingobacterium sp.]|nr:hypothetical protein [Sphingobacterium sp.]
MRRASAILFLIKLLKIPVSLYSYSLMATLFGVSLAKDQWLLAYSLIIIIDLAIWGPLNETFRVKFITVKEQMGQKTALQQTQSLLYFIFLFSIAVVAFVMLKPDIVSSLLVSDYSEGQREGLNHMIRIVAPILLINQATLIGISILNAYDIFYIPEIATFASQLCGIFIMLFTAQQLGIYSLVLSTMLGLVILLTLVIIKIKHKKIDLFGSFSPRFGDFKQYFIFALPLFVPYCIGQFNALVEKRLVTGQGVGSVSIIDFSKKFPDMVNAIFSSVLLTILIPVLARAFVKKDEQAYTKNFVQVFSLGILGLGFFAIYMFLASQDLMCFFYGNSDITPDNMIKIIDLNVLYSVALIAIFIYLIFSMGLLAIGKNRTSAFASTVTQVLVILSNIFFVNRFGVIIFPISVFIAHILGGIYMLCYYPYSTKAISISFVKNTVMLFVVLFFMTLIMRGINAYLPSGTVHLFRLTVIGVVQLVLFILIGYLVRLEEITSSIVLIKRKLGRS